ncbi:histidine phosphatase family protein [Phormidium tenue]|jgi:probable phosphoglycerate mutase|uniref:Histidine phosphatase family protein n=1 Tax=Phormidium tenue FACHB-1050 TaxID=2692857 RepID=A0ABR8CFB1_9CYAN|nr:histidine phosphatase family protein [Phormidium tenue]MBD2319418.1 histidine phosphatase family protein [Phormidium tenue FACHB-1050]
MKLVIVRHGETESNVQHKVMGQLDSPLTFKGIQQAKAIADRLRRLKFTSIYSSDLGRAVQTANIIAETCGKQIIFDAELREWNMGIFEGLTVSEMHEKFPQERQDYEQIGDEYIIPKGESLTQCRARGFRILNAIAERHSDENVVVVTHGCVLMGFFEMVLDLRSGNTWRFKLDNANFCTFEYVKERWSLVVWNDVSHLEMIEPCIV